MGAAAPAGASGMAGHPCGRWADGRPPRALHHRLGRPRLVEGAPRLHQEEPADVAERGAAALTHQQVDAEGRLQSQDLLGEGRLGHVQPGRRAADRRRIHRGRRAPVSVAAATAALAVPQMATVAADPAAQSADHTTAWPTNESRDLDTWDDSQDDNQPWRIVREKEHPGEPMTVEDALFHMELLGHDFYLFNDKESGRPSVVYRRRAYDYGVLSLNVNS